ncbi:type I-E CRISPR-associated protein Cas7/Cse4/CasC [Corynebacterium kozikiae]|uniref:type I-E CRISPR-associated protein Cas7/Cse4/CasC n=1 Tax=Corynebacterium kozikiae TaxID=2968469 RepID=UPI00211C5987|nr:type I-E CRISPR-associated protein Cas7/Cse4/CasC [Corynebacterium sp. 76QC2CO]MCQ9342969.1 type I-E CRISPR-associated protein Cas7/Cse4/CasC [Corynebacterium sp. 76QC2CO]
MSLVIDIHALHTLPPSLINRDDTGAPKSAIFGGVPRQRVSSQAWKRAMRKYFGEHFGEELVGTRSTRMPEVIATRAVELNPELDIQTAIEGATSLFKAAKIGIQNPQKPKKNEEKEVYPYPTTKYLIFLSPAQIERAAQVIAQGEATAIKKAEATQILDTEHSVDIAAFGRMVADNAMFNVDASIQVAHALGVHESSSEFDYFTAVDDAVEAAEETGAAMLGTVQFTSSTLYRFATINVDGLAENLGSKEAAVTTASQLVDAFISSMPTGKINTFANQTLPELVYITIRNDRSVSLINAFESPVEATDGKSRRQVAAQRLAAESTAIEEAYGLKPTAAFAVALGDLVEPFQEIATLTTMTELGSQIESALQGA